MTQARLAMQIEVVKKAFVKRTPSEARRSMFGVLITGLPMQPIASHRWSSDIMKMMLGGAIPKAFGFEAATRPQLPENTAAAAVPAVRERNWRLFRFFIFIVFIQEVRSPFFCALDGLLAPPFGDFCVVAA